jgi:hypothetical protein
VSLMEDVETDVPVPAPLLVLAEAAVTPATS